VKLPLARPSTQQEMGTGRLGQGLCTKEHGRPRTPRLKEAQLDNGSQNVVEMAENTKCHMDANLEEKIHSLHAGQPTDQAQRLNIGFKHLEHSLEKQRPNTKACLLGDPKWRKHNVLARLMATN